MTNFVVNVSGPVGGNVPTTARSLGGGVPPGTYTVNVTAVNACGSTTTASQNVTVQ